jgi:uncharacterized repeat protein (TIGR03943 family)
MSSRSARRPRRSLSPWLEVLAIAAWGILLLKFWLTGQLFLLIHPNYLWLTIAAAVVLLGMSSFKALWLIKTPPQAVPAAHANLLPSHWSSGILLGIAILGLCITPRAFASDTAIQRGVGDTLTLTRVKPQTFRGSGRTEDKSLVDWIRTLQVYPEPDAYTGQKASVIGFVVHPNNLPPQYLYITRFVMTCCAADVYPVSMPVKLSTGDRTAYKPDTWLEVSGQMTTEQLGDKRQLTIVATSLKPVPQPKDPYNY